jgi:hypothetical protein
MCYTIIKGGDKMDKDRIDLLMKNLGITESEAIEVLEADQQIDKGEKLFELTAEQEKAAKQARQAPRAPTVIKFTQREKKAKPEKAQICSAMIEGLQQLGIADLQVVNDEREFLFTLDGIKYKVTLACPRK